ncbi:hypothetical protein GO621_18725 [Mucilaginibacter sp. HMF7410]|uniref:DUF6438 domain-containing protein n=2 Tax=Mucilaginibacter arboris TaxID=2682090 RepID=A0A7K1T1Y3_9SPHI|nr:hypothetical protein [Mucilaginibacter arboris]
MKTIKLTTTIIILVTLFGCSANKKDYRQNVINRIVFATGGCFGTCPIQVIDIDSSLTFKYHGVENTNNIGFYSGRITNGFWDTLNLKLESIKYRQLDTSYEHSVDDLSTELYVYSDGNNVKHISGQSASLPDSIMTVYRWLLTSIKQLKFERTTNNFIFPTLTEKPLPKSTIDHVKFPPPEIDSNKKKRYH